MISASGIPQVADMPQAVFDQIDSNSDGVITQREWETFCNIMPNPLCNIMPNPQQGRPLGRPPWSMVDGYDINGDGLSFSEIPSQTKLQNMCEPVPMTLKE